MKLFHMVQKIAILFLVLLFISFTGCIGAAPVSQVISPCEEATVIDKWINSVDDHLILLADGRLASTDQTIYLRLKEGITYGFNIPLIEGKVWSEGNLPGQIDNRVYQITAVCQEGHL